MRGAAGRVAGDLLRGVEHVTKGRRGLSGDQVLRLLVLKQLTGFSYEQLAFHLADSSTYRRFCLLGDLSLEQGNTADSAMTIAAVWRVAKLFGAVPEQATFDAGFASQANQQALVEMGVTDAAFAKNSAIDVLHSVTSAKVHRALQRLRAGIEASISWLKRCFGFGRCTWSGFESFRAYAWASVLAVNLLQMTRLSA